MATLKWLSGIILKDHKVGVTLRGSLFLPLITISQPLEHTSLFSFPSSSPLHPPCPYPPSHSFSLHMCRNQAYYLPVLLNREGPTTLHLECVALLGDGSRTDLDLAL